MDGRVAGKLTPGDSGIPDLDKAARNAWGIYDIAGASHATVVKAEGCNLPPGQLDWAPVTRATLLRLDRWIAGSLSTRHRRRLG